MNQAAGRGPRRWRRAGGSLPSQGLITVFPLSCSVNGSKMITGGIIFEISVIPNVSRNEKKKNVFCVRTKKEIKHEKVSFSFFSSCEVLFLVRELRARESSWRGSTGDYWSKARQRELAIPYIHQFSSRSRLRTVRYITERYSP